MTDAERAGHVTQQHVQYLKSHFLKLVSCQALQETIGKVFVKPSYGCSPIPHLESALGNDL
jgi:hypothetical protein